ncbi:hypothetical protein FRC02_005260 [Tulasnella sp. 418]|nr:hypothetical protein FRC02_005260 [Tulasnella sp. 418]
MLRALLHHYHCQITMSKEAIQAISRLSQIKALFKPKPLSQHSFRLPDSSNVLFWVTQDAIDIQIDNVAFVSLRSLNRKHPPAPIGCVEPRLNVPVAVIQLVSPQNLPLEERRVWAALYTLFINRTVSRAILNIAPTIPNAPEIRRYLLESGLGGSRRDLVDPNDLVISRFAFWQGAGAPQGGGWLNPTGKAFMSNTPFPFIPTSTRQPTVIASHPLRPPKPKAGDIIYRRYIHTVQKVVSFVALDIDDEVHFQCFHKWSNLDRVNSAWKEAGSEDQHLAYLQERVKDPHSISIIGYWDDCPFGYFEVYWVKEDHTNTFGGTSLDYDRGCHVLVGDDDFRGFEYRLGWTTSIAHLMFLWDPRTTRLVNEPSVESPIVLMSTLSTGFSVEKEFDFPHKRSAYLTITRERFLQLPLLQ